MERFGTKINGNIDEDKGQGPTEKTTEVAKAKERETMDPSSVIQIERKFDNPFTKKSRELADIFGIPSGGFSGLSVSMEGGKHERLSPKLDELAIKHFTNARYIVDKLNNIGPISTKDPRERYEGEIGVVIKKTKQDLDDFKKGITQELADLEKRRIMNDILKRRYERAKQLLKDASEIYKILIGGLKLKKRGFAFLGQKEITGVDIGFEDAIIKTNELLEIKYLSGGGFVILHGYVHDSEWQQNFGDSRNQEIGLANIYKDVRYVAIEGLPRIPYGESIKFRWQKSSKKHYDRLMKELVKNGFKGEFLELDSRFEGEDIEKTFDMKKLTLKEAKILFAYLQKYNPQLAKDIGSIKGYREIFHKQRTDSFIDSIESIMKRKGLVRTKDGTHYHNIPSVKKDKDKDKEGKFVRFLSSLTDFKLRKKIKFSSTLTGFELGQTAFSDALSVIKILLMNKAMQDGKLEQGIIVDFQGSYHLSYKSYFFDNPGYAMEVVLNNLHELLASHPDVKNRKDILNKLQNLDEKTWEWAFDFIGTIPFYRVAEPTKDKDYVEIGDRQRPIIEQKPFCATEELSEDNQKRLNKVIAELSK